MCRRGDLVVRLGGDEFVLILRDLDSQGAARVFERVRDLLDSHSFQGVPDSIPLSASIGVLSIEADERRDLGEILVAASSAMQLSKKQGRNRVTFA